MFRKTIYSFVSLTLVVCIAGCSLFVPHTQTVTINGKPSDATIVVNGQHLTSPTTVRVKRNRNVNIVVSKDGYSTFFLQSGYSISPWGTLDVIGGICFLFPFFGLLSPGAYELDQDNFYYVLTPAKN